MSVGAPYCGLVASVPLIFERDYELPPAIVWDALVDADLVGGWLALATIDARPGGEYSLSWMRRSSAQVCAGRIVSLRPAEKLVVSLSAVGRLVFELEKLTGGSRGTSTRLRVTLETDADAPGVPIATADWLTNLEQLEELLRGRPVDWARWESDWYATWARHHDEATRSAG